LSTESTGERSQLQGIFGFKEKPEAFIRPDLSADLLHAKRSRAAPA
jgi:hypothetical protein